MKKLFAALGLFFGFALATGAHAQGNCMPWSSCQAAYAATTSNFSLGGMTSDGYGNIGLSSIVNAAPPLAKSDIIPSRNLAKFVASGTPTVCGIGDSTWSSANYIDFSDSLGQKIQSSLRSAYPDKTITFKDFSIGGTGMSQFTLTGTALQGLGITLPSWFTTPSQTWNSYVAAAGCTTVFVDWGVNDTGYEYNSTIENLLTPITLYSTVPDVVFVNNAVANPNAGAPYNSTAYQSGYLSNGALQRMVAQSSYTYGIANVPPIGLVDVNRAFAETVLGYDPGNQYLQYLIAPGNGVAPITSFPYIFPTNSGGDFTTSFTVNNGGAIATAGNVVITLIYASSAGGQTGAGESDFVAILPTGGTLVYAQVYYSEKSNNLLNNNANVWVPGNNTIVVTVKKNRLIVSINGTMLQDVILPHPQSGFAPGLSISNAPLNTAVTLNYYAGGVPIPYKATIPAATCYGPLAGIGANSGNGLNHDSSVCLNAVYQRAIDQTTWR